MGANPFAGGVAFRVWAPFAVEVCAAGTFNGWHPSSVALASEGNGYWSCDVAGARVGDEYKFIIINPGDGVRRWKNDPYARSLTNSVGNSVIAPIDYKWRSQGYSTPPWNELVIYELHVGSFAFDPTTRSGRGDFDTVIAKLDYLAELGINAIQLMPSDEFGRHLMGLQPGVHLRHRRELWRAQRVAPTGRRRPWTWHRRDLRRGIQPLRP